MRVYSGTLAAGSYVLNSTKGKRERISRLVQLQADNRTDVDHGLCRRHHRRCWSQRHHHRRHIFLAENSPVILESMNFPDPVISVAIEPKTKGDADKLGVSLGRLAEEDPTFKVRVDHETGQTIISGMGELHLEIIVDRLLREFKVEANVGKPQVAYRETIKKSVSKIDGKFIRQSGGRGQYGHVVLDLEPLENRAKASNLSTRSSVVPFPRNIFRLLKSVFSDTLVGGVLAGYPIIDIRATLVFGSYHEVDSNEMAFRTAASIGFKDGFMKASPILLEPIMRVEVEVPEEFMGDVIGDISSRRGRIEGMETDRQSLQG